MCVCVCVCRLESMVGDERLGEKQRICGGRSSSILRLERVCETIHLKMHLFI